MKGKKLFSQIIRLKVRLSSSNNKRSKKQSRKTDIITQEKRIREPRKFIICINMLNSIVMQLRPITTNQLQKSMVSAQLIQIKMQMWLTGIPNNWRSKRRKCFRNYKIHMGKRNKLSKDLMTCSTSPLSKGAQAKSHPARLDHKNDYTILIDKPSLNLL